MRSVSLATLSILSIALGYTYAAHCVESLSCSDSAVSSGADPCCTPSPGGLFVFRQRFEPDTGSDAGSWGIDGMEVLGCTTQTTPASPCAPAYSHEEIGSYCHNSELFGEEDGFLQAEGEWAQSEVGEGVEERWERSWQTAGRYVSTFAPHCHPEQPAEADVPAFFHALHQLHGKFPTARLLADADITPSTDTTFSLSELVNAVTFGGHHPIVTCENATLESVLWPLEVQGAFQHGSFHPFRIDRQSSCPAEGIIYPPSTTRPAPTPTHTWDPLHRPPPRPITLSHDESKLYYQAKNDPVRLEFFKGNDGDREDQKEERMEKQYMRDEL